VALLLHKLHIMQLRELVDSLRGAPYFQFVVEVTKVKHTKNGTIPRRIEISDSLPPVKLELSAGDLKKNPTREQKVW
jgi:hypothetical protein